MALIHSHDKWSNASANFQCALKWSIMIYITIKFIEIGSAGVKYFNTETISTTKCENTVIFNLEIWATSMKNTWQLWNNVDLFYYHDYCYTLSSFLIKSYIGKQT